MNIFLILLIIEQIEGIYNDYKEYKTIKKYTYIKTLFYIIVTILYYIKG